MMKKIYGWTTNLFRYIYILLVAVWLCSRLYVMRQSLFGKTVLIQVAFSLIVPFIQYNDFGMIGNRFCDLAHLSLRYRHFLHWLRQINCNSQLSEQV